MTLEHKVALDPLEHQSGMSIHYTAGGHKRLPLCLRHGGLGWGCPPGAGFLIESRNWGGF